MKNNQIVNSHILVNKYPKIITSLFFFCLSTNDVIKITLEFPGSKMKNYVFFKKVKLYKQILNF